MVKSLLIKRLACNFWCYKMFITIKSYDSISIWEFIFTVFEAPRLHGVSGLPLPSARKVSNHVHRGVGPDILQQDVTLFLMQWGQFTDHDIVLTPVPSGKYKYEGNSKNLLFA